LRPGADIDARSLGDGVLAQMFGDLGGVLEGSCGHEHAQRLFRASSQPVEGFGRRATVDDPAAARATKRPAPRATLVAQP
jgi:hypothetical protein